ncbi:glycosyltransferase family 2 protein [Pedobacter rhodius]|uniref:Glycosyltransferase n=1 Tax=Pedobacter rhodius TaxID=3004098 RepID=A0ABT4KZK6_9SPHI|nr:glycosyltransferase [Pedobacter sp. SJ11]MCZ4224373.1 glycosyltransferase [Pedobacter sp. SJ11]
MSSQVDKKRLSICIPTRGRREILRTTLLSIFSSGISTQLYEVVVYDSSDSNLDLNSFYGSFGMANLRFVHGVNYGYLNLIEALKLGEGEYLKLHNDYSSFLPNSLNIMIEEVGKAAIEKPLLVFSNNTLEKMPNKLTASTFNDFLYILSYYSTWSTLFGVWKEDFDLVKDCSINPMFPHTSILYANSYKNSYSINNNLLFFNQEVGNKGGYNLFRVFAVEFLNMANELRINSIIVDKTFNKIKRDMFFTFLIRWYSETKILKNSYTFILSNIRESILIHYSLKDYYLLLFLAYVRSIKKVLIKMFLGSKSV